MINSFAQLRTALIFTRILIRSEPPLKFSVRFSRLLCNKTWNLIQNFDTCSAIEHHRLSLMWFNKIFVRFFSLRLPHANLAPHGVIIKYTVDGSRFEFRGNSGNPKHNPFTASAPWYLLLRPFLNKREKKKAQKQQRKKTKQKQA